MREGSEVDFTISVFLFCTFEDLPLILVGLSANPKKRTRFRNQRYLMKLSLSTPVTPLPYPTTLNHLESTCTFYGTCSHPDKGSASACCSRYSIKTLALFY